MADDDKAVFARCPAFNIECQYVAEVDRLSAENERLTAIVADRLLGSSVDHRTLKDIIAENERLREAGKDLGFYAGHDDSCDCVKGWAKGPCNCGYTETWKQWSAALGETK